MKKSNLIQNLVFAVAKAMLQTEGQYKYIKIEKNTIFSHYKIEIRKD